MAPDVTEFTNIVHVFGSNDVSLIAFHAWYPELSRTVSSTSTMTAGGRDWYGVESSFGMIAVQFGSARAWSRRSWASAKIPVVVARYSTDRCIQRTAFRMSWGGGPGLWGAGGAAAGGGLAAGAVGAAAVDGGAGAGAAQPIAATRVRTTSHIPAWRTPILALIHVLL